MNGSTRYAAYTQGINPYYYGVADERHTVMGLTENTATDSGLSLVGACDYKAYGEENEGNLGLDTSNNFAWNQEYQDVDNELVYLRSRFYDPKTMRFISMDNLLLDNKYVFGNGDPINNIDPFGHFAFLIPFLIAAAEAVDAAVQVIGERGR